MSYLVLDASVMLRWVVDDEVPWVAARVRELLVGEAWRALVPSLWHWEVANALVVAERRRALADAMPAAWVKVERWFAVVETDHRPAAAVRDAVALARQYGLTTYDAAYLELALRQPAPLATLDLKLRGAAQARGVAVDF